MHITIIGTEAGSRLLARALNREHHEVDIWIKREKTPPSDLRHFQMQLYDDAKEIVEADFSKTDAFVFCEQSPAALGVVKFLSAYKKPVHFVTYDEDMFHVIKKDPTLFGIDYLYDYGEILAERIHRFFYDEEGMQTEIFENFGSALVKLDIGHDPVFVGRRVKNIGALEELVLVSIRRDGDIIVPDGNTILEAHDVIRLIGETEAVRRFRRRHSVADPFDAIKSEKRFIVYGDGEGAEAIEAFLSKEGADTLAIKKSRKLPQGVRYVLEGTIVDILEDLDIATYDGFVAASTDDAANFLAASAARDVRMGNVALCLRDERFMRIVDVAHNGGIFSAELLVAQKIKRNLFGPPDISLHMFPGSLEIYEIVLKEDVYATDKRIDELDLAHGFLIGGIERAGESVLAKGKTVLKDGDRLIIFLLPNRSYDLSKFLRRKPKSFLTELFSI